MGRIRMFVPILLVLFVVSACGSQTAAPAPTTAPAAPAATTAPAPATGGDLVVDKAKLSAELKFYNWTDYIDPTVLEDFEKEYGVKVVLDNYDANEDMIAKVRAGNSGYDIAAPSDYAVETMWREDLLQPLDQSLLPNMKNLDPELLNKYFDQGNKFSVPYLYGITGIAYNTKSFPEGVDSWSVLFDTAKIANYKGQFSMLDDERETVGAALRFGGQSLNSTDPAAMQTAEELLKAQKEYIAAYNSSDVNRKLASGEYVIAHSWSGSAMQARRGLGDEFSGNPDINFVIPKEGGMIWMDNLVILKESPNAYTAHVFINYLLRPDIAVRITDYVGYLTPNTVALPQLPAEVQELYKAGFAPDAEVYKRLEWAVRNEETKIFTDVWTRIKGE
jgi:spermidine/putrescine transport system substrate-binding protein